MRRTGFIFCKGLIFLTICGLIGWCYETVLTSILWGKFCGFFARGLLHLPVCPIYGFFALLLLTMFRIPFLKRQIGWRKGICAFFIGSVVSTVLELICSYLLEWFLHRSLWSYESWPLHFQGRISLVSSLLFGVLTVLLISIVTPAFRHITRRLPKQILCIIGIFCGLSLEIDLLLSLYL